VTRGFVYQTATVDWGEPSRAGTSDGDHVGELPCSRALEGAFAKYALPEIVNTDKATSSPQPTSPM